MLVAHGTSETVVLPSRAMMPFIASRFLRREHGDRPKLVPDGSINLAFVRPLCEASRRRLFFTVEYSSAALPRWRYPRSLGAETRAAARLHGSVQPARAVPCAQDFARDRELTGSDRG